MTLQPFSFLKMKVITRAVLVYICRKVHSQHAIAVFIVLELHGLKKWQEVLLPTITDGEVSTFHLINYDVKFFMIVLIEVQALRKDVLRRPFCE